jgi:hypothetical protein
LQRLTEEKEAMQNELSIIKKEENAYAGQDALWIKEMKGKPFTFLHFTTINEP